MSRRLSHLFVLWCYGCYMPTDAPLPDPLPAGERELVPGGRRGGPVARTWIGMGWDQIFSATRSRAARARGLAVNSASAGRTGRRVTTPGLGHWLPVRTVV